jgi:hypothetical protein
VKSSGLVNCIYIYESMRADAYVPALAARYASMIMNDAVASYSSIVREALLSDGLRVAATF